MIAILAVIGGATGWEDMALLGRLAISVLNQETSKQRSLKQKAKRASMSPDYMLTVLAAGLKPQHIFWTFFLRLPWGCPSIRCR